MSLRTIAAVATITLTVWPADSRTSLMNHKSIQATRQQPAEPHAHTRAHATITVHSSEVKPYDESASPPLMELHLTETFAGDIDGESTVRALQLQRTDKSASMVSMQRVRATLGDRHGTFVLQGSESVENGTITATWSVVPGSGTGALSGLCGKGGFKGSFGKNSEGTLDYWFE